MDKIYVSKEGLQEFLEELEKKRKFLEKNLQFQGEAIRNAPGDGWHDNFAFEEAIQEERRISNELQKMILDKQKLEIISEEKKDKSETTTEKENINTKTEKENESDNSTNAKKEDKSDNTTNSQ